MFDTYDILKALHILLVAIWLGTDIGTFISFLRMRDASLSVETRRAMLGLSEFLDMGPRTALIGLLTLGITLTHIGGWGFTGEGGAALAVIASLVAVLWIGGVWHQFWVTHPPGGIERGQGHVRFEERFRPFDIGFRIVVTSLLTLAALWSLLSSGGVITADWLSIKLLLFAVIVGLGVGLRLLLPTIGARVGDIFTNGSTPAREAALTPVARQAQWMVIGIWTAIVLITWLAVAKP